MGKNSDGIWAINALDEALVEKKTSELFKEI